MVGLGSLVGRSVLLAEVTVSGVVCFMFAVSEFLAEIAVPLLELHISLVGE